MDNISCFSSQQLPALSSDGYVRLFFETLSDMPFTHLSSGADENYLLELRLQTVSAISAGFSEWASKTSPVISLGWGWYIDQKTQRLLLAPDIVRSNVMLIDVYGYDLGASTTSTLFGAWLAGYDWQKSVAQAISHK